jgi:hypothetical protein
VTVAAGAIAAEDSPIRTPDADVVDDALNEAEPPIAASPDDVMLEVAESAAEPNLITSAEFVVADEADSEAERLNVPKPLADVEPVFVIVEDAFCTLIALVTVPDVLTMMELAVPMRKPRPSTVADADIAADRLAVKNACDDVLELLEITDAAFCTLFATADADADAEAVAAASTYLVAEK